jgi:hypothetical protein
MLAPPREQRLSDGRLALQPSPETKSSSVTRLGEPMSFPLSRSVHARRARGTFSSGQRVSESEPHQEARMNRTVRSVSQVVLALSLRAAPVWAQRSHIGVHAGYDFDTNDAVVGGQVSLPLNRYVELYPSVDVYLVSTGSLVAFSGDLKYRLAPRARPELYLGGGVNVLRSGAGGATTTDTGWDLFGGVESRLGYIHPYVEGRGRFHGGRSAFQLNAGLNVTLF